MKERVKFGELGFASFLGCLIGVVLLDVVSVLWDGTLSGFYSGQITLFVGILLMGGLVAAITAWPLGCAIGWLVSRTERATAAHATIAGALTGVVWIGLAWGWTILAYVEQMSYFPALVLGFAVLGAVSGWCAFRIVFRRRFASDEGKA
jgi:hypothetical protein